MIPRRTFVFVLAAMTLALTPWFGPRPQIAGAQILPTTTTVPPSSSSTTRPKPSTTATTKPGSTTSSRPRSTSSSSSSSSSTTITTIAPPTSIVQDEEPPAVQGQGDLSKVFAILSGLGFAVAIGMVGTQLYRTRREDARLAERAREILSRRALRRSRRPPQP